MIATAGDFRPTTAQPTKHTRPYPLEYGWTGPPLFEDLKVGQNPSVASIFWKFQNNAKIIERRPVQKMLSASPNDSLSRHLLDIEKDAKPTVRIVIRPLILLQIAVRWEHSHYKSRT